MLSLYQRSAAAGGTREWRLLVDQLTCGPDPGHTAAAANGRRQGRGSMGEFSLTERDGHVLLVTINRPEVMNACHPPASRELAGVFDEFAADPDLWIAIITGAGDRAFS